MEKQQRDAINGLTHDIGDILGADVPVDINMIVCKLGGHIKETEDVRYGSVRKCEDGFEICVNPTLCEETKRFTIAHELGHLFLDMGYLMDEKRWENMGDEKIWF